MICKPGHPNAYDGRGNVAEHTVVMSEVLGRPLHKRERVHHLNGIRDDNRPGNLELWLWHHPSGQRVTDRIKDALELLRTYAPDVKLWPKGEEQIMLVLSFGRNREAP